MLSVVERKVERAPPAVGVLRPMPTVQVRLLVRNAGSSPLLKRQNRTARRNFTRDIITITSDADQGVDQAIGQGAHPKGLTEQKAKSPVGKGSTKLGTWRVQRRGAQVKREKVTTGKISRNSTTATEMKIAFQTIAQVARPGIRKRRRE